MKAEQLANQVWYEGHVLSRLLIPLSWLFGALARLRRSAFRYEMLSATRLPLPVIVVGNITVGGTGKTPVVIAVVRLLQEAGYTPGVVSRGYGRRSDEPELVRPDSDAEHCGDEPLLIARCTGVPVAVGSDRVAAARLLMSQQVDVIVSDDGLQHYALARKLEIAVIDGRRRFGNGRLLPAGPLREYPSRLRSVDLVLINGGEPEAGEFALSAQLLDPRRLADDQRRELQSFRAGPVHAVAGIADPEKFFVMLRGQGLEVIDHPFADHHVYARDDLHFGDGLPVLMTGKDAVKCESFTAPNLWEVPLQLSLPQAARERLLARLQA